MFLLKVIRQLEKHKIPYAIAGGYALALHGIVRATMDVDLILNLKKSDFVKFEKAMKELSLQSRLPLLAEQVIDFRKEYIQERNLIAWSFINFKDPTEVVDVILLEDLNKVKTIKVSVGDKKVNVITLKELERMKKQSGRAQDLVDLESINMILGGKKNGHKK